MFTKLTFGNGLLSVLTMPASLTIAADFEMAGLGLCVHGDLLGVCTSWPPGERQHRLPCGRAGLRPDSSRKLGLLYNTRYRCG